MSSSAFNSAESWLFWGVFLPVVLNLRPRRRSPPPPPTPVSMATKRDLSAHRRLLKSGSRPPENSPLRFLGKSKTSGVLGVGGDGGGLQGFQNPSGPGPGPGGGLGGSCDTCGNATFPAAIPRESEYSDPPMLMCRADLLTSLWVNGGARTRPRPLTHVGPGSSISASFPSTKARKNTMKRCLST